MKKLVLSALVILVCAAILGGCAGNVNDAHGVTAGRSEAGVDSRDVEPPSTGDMAYEVHSFGGTSGRRGGQGGRIMPGLMTAGVWNDNQNHDFLLELIQTNSDFRRFESMWRFNLSQQVKVGVTNNGYPLNNIQVELTDGNEGVLFSAVTNNNGTAYLFNNMSAQAETAWVRAYSNGVLVKTAFDPAVRLYEFDITYTPAATQKSLDLMFVIDTTGSMGDELEYLKVELEDIIRQVRQNHANIDIRLSIIVYRDFGDEYVVRPSDFSRDIDSQITFLREQRANGGGDWEEAVHIALAEALEQQTWRGDATARLMFLVLDAPPHNTDPIRNEMHRLTHLSAEMGVRIIPVAASGIDTVTEFLMRTLSMATGGTYVFITGDSGIGHGHIDPTIGEHEVVLLNELLVDIVNSYLFPAKLFRLVY